MSEKYGTDIYQSNMFVTIKSCVYVTRTSMQAFHLISIAIDTRVPYVHV